MATRGHQLDAIGLDQVCTVMSKEREDGAVGRPGFAKSFERLHADGPPNGSLSMGAVSFRE
jgi:hypothetical protein